MKIGSCNILTASPLSQPARKPCGTASLAHRQRPLYRRKRRNYTGKERDIETGLYYYGARYLDSRTGRWLSGDPAIGEYVPEAPVNDEARKRNKNLPGQGGVFNYVNLHVYHYAGNNPVKLVDPDGEQAGPPVTQQPNFLPPINTPYNREPAYRGMMTRHNSTRAVADAALIGSNAIGIIIDKIFLGGKYQEAARKFAIKVELAFADIKRQAAGMLEADSNGKYSDMALELYVDYVNNTMMLNYTDQRELGPYENSVKVPRITKKQADYELNLRFRLDIKPNNNKE